MQAPINPVLQAFDTMLTVECSRCSAPRGLSCGKLSEATGEWVKRRHGTHACRMERLHALARARTEAGQRELWVTKPTREEKQSRSKHRRVATPEETQRMLGAVGAGPIAAEAFFISAQVGIAPFRMAVAEGLLVTKRVRGVCYIQLASWAAPKGSIEKRVIPADEPAPPTAAEEVGLHRTPEEWEHASGGAP